MRPQGTKLSMLKNKKIIDLLILQMEQEEYT